MNRTMRYLPLLGVATLAAGLTACGTVDPYGPNNYPQAPITQSAPYGAPVQQQQAGYVEYGRVTNVALVSNGSTASSGNSTAGTLLGAVVGGALGNQVGHGGGRAAATILGAVGGAAVGNRIASNNNPNPSYNTAGPVYRVWVQTDQGAQRTYDVSSTGDLRPGDRVRIENGVIYLS
jgi:outer membrane lipoprotein SlyB